MTSQWKYHEESRLELAARLGPRPIDRPIKDKRKKQKDYVVRALDANAAIQYTDSAWIVSLDLSFSEQSICCADLKSHSEPTRLPTTEFQWLELGESSDQQVVVATHHLWIQVVDLLTFRADSAQLMLSLGNLLQDLAST
jgi:hypothetical protein